MNKLLHGMFSNKIAMLIGFLQRLESSIDDQVDAVSFHQTCSLFINTPLSPSVFQIMKRKVL